MSLWTDGLEDVVGPGAEPLRQSFDVFPDGIGIAVPVRGADGNAVDFLTAYANPALLAMIHLPPDRVVGRPLGDLSPELRAIGQLSAYADVLETGVPFTDEFTFEPVGGDIRIAGIFQVTAVRLGEGLLCMYRDVTALRRAEAARDRMAAIVESSDDAIIGSSPDGRITHWNPGAERLLGYSREEVTGQPVRMLVRPEDFEDQNARFGELVAGRRIDRIETRWVRKDRTLVDVVLTASPIFDREGGVAGVSAIVHDVTQRRRVEAELSRSNAELEQFAAIAAHDLRAPLAAISHFAELLARQGELDTTGRELVDSIALGAIRGRELIDGLRSMSGVGHGEPSRREVSLRGLVEDVLATLSPQLEESGAEVVVGELPVVLGDATELRQLFQNLLGNAVKFRSADPPRIAVDAARARGAWVVSVADNGIGVPAGEAERVFEVFARRQRRRGRRGHRHRPRPLPQDRRPPRRPDLGRAGRRGRERLLVRAARHRGVGALTSVYESFGRVLTTCWAMIL